MRLDVDNPVEDAELTRALADVMVQLRNRHYGEVLGHLGEALQGSGTAFLDTLARHLHFEEQKLFPALRKASPEAAAEVRLLESEHGRLRAMADEMARAIERADFDYAYAVSRTFLAELYTHIDHETDLTDRISKDAPAGPPSP